MLIHDACEGLQTAVGIRHVSACDRHGNCEWAAGCSPHAAPSSGSALKGRAVQGIGGAHRPPGKCKWPSSALPFLSTGLKQELDVCLSRHRDMGWQCFPGIDGVVLTARMMCVCGCFLLAEAMLELDSMLWLRYQVCRILDKG